MGFGIPAVSRETCQLRGAAHRIISDQTHWVFPVFLHLRSTLPVSFPFQPTQASITNSCLEHWAVNKNKNPRKAQSRVICNTVSLYKPSSPPTAGKKKSAPNSHPLNLQYAAVAGWVYTSCKNSSSVTRDSSCVGTDLLRVFSPHRRQIPHMQFSLRQSTQHTMSIFNFKINTFTSSLLQAKITKSMSLLWVL